MVMVWLETVGELLTYSGLEIKRARETFLYADDDALKSRAKTSLCKHISVSPVTLKLLDAGILKYKAVNWEDGINVGQDKHL